MGTELESNSIQESFVKKVYSKPVINQIRLAAEEAVLAICKTGGFNQCITVPGFPCTYTPGS